MPVLTSEVAVCSGANSHEMQVFKVEFTGIQISIYRQFIIASRS